MIKGKPLPLRLNIVGQFWHPVIEAGHRDAARVIMQGGDDLGQDARGVHRHAAVHARVQVKIRAGDGDLFAHQAAQHRHDRRHLGLEHASIADHRIVGA